MVFYLDGKPLLVDYAGTPAHFQSNTGPWNDLRYTMRHLTGFVSEQYRLWDFDPKGYRISKYGYWSWEDRGNSTFPIVNGHPDFMVVTAANRGVPCGWECSSKRAGRAGGKTFTNKWEYAMEVGPRVVLVQSFGQWTGCSSKPGENMDEEYSTDIEPQASGPGSHGDLYLRLLGNYSALFKKKELKQALGTEVAQVHK
jgi:hypothetical protein